MFGKILGQAGGETVKGALEGIGSLAKDLRAAITGQEAIPSETKVRLEEIAAHLEQKTLEAETSLVQAVNQTMQQEGQSEHWPQWAWRPFWGFVSGLAFAGVVFFCLYLGKLAIIDGDMTKLNMIPQLVTSFTGLFAIPGAILGVSAWHRGKQKRGQ